MGTKVTSTGVLDIPMADFNAWAMTMIPKSTGTFTTLGVPTVFQDEQIIRVKYNQSNESQPPPPDTKKNNGAVTPSSGVPGAP